MAENIEIFRELQAALIESKKETERVQGELAVALEMLTDLRDENVELRKLPELLERWRCLNYKYPSAIMQIRPAFHSQWEIMYSVRGGSINSYKNSHITKALQWVLDVFEGE